MSIQTHRFSVTVNCSLYGPPKLYEDHGLLILPESYSETGKPTRLVISCHGGGGGVSDNDSQIEHTVPTMYLLANGYAVMDVNGLPAKYAAEKDIDIRHNIGSPIAIESYVSAYRYCMEHFNLKPEVFVTGGSMGGVSSANIVLSGLIPVIAHCASCPVLDAHYEMYLHPWNGGMPKKAMGKIYDLATDENGDYIYDAEKVNPYSPAEIIKTKKYPVPVAFWHCADDNVVSCEVTQAFVDRVNANGGEAHLTIFPSGKHVPHQYGEPVADPMGITQFQGQTLQIRPAAEGFFRWIRKHDKE
jgi:dipeptidyl aminopeptidase/acylaminoacyl peptidase